MSFIVTATELFRFEMSLSLRCFCFYLIVRLSILYDYSSYSSFKASLAGVRGTFLERKEVFTKRELGYNLALSRFSLLAMLN